MTNVLVFLGTVIGSAAVIAGGLGLVVRTIVNHAEHQSSQPMAARKAG